MGTMDRHIAIYCRVSGDRQTTESQKGDLQRWVDAYAENLPVIWYEDVSNDHKLMNRPSWKRLEHCIQMGEVAKLVVWRLDRLGRSTRKLLDLFELLRYNDTHFISLKEQFDLNTPIGRLIGSILANIAEWERESISMRVRAGLERRKQQGIKRRRVNRPVKATREVQQRIWRMHKDGYSAPGIGKELSLSAGHVRRLIKKMKYFHRGEREEKPPPVRRKKKHYKITPENVRVLRSMIERDCPRKDIADALGVSRSYLYDLIRMYCGEEKVSPRTKMERALELDPELAILEPEEFGIRLEDLVE